MDYRSERGSRKAAEGLSSIDPPSIYSSGTPRPAYAGSAFSFQGSTMPSVHFSFQGSTMPSIQRVDSDSERISQSGHQALIAARNILLSGGTQATAEAAAYSIIKGNEGGKGFFGRKKVNQAAKSQAALVASMALLSANEILEESTGTLSDDASPPYLQSEYDFTGHQAAADQTAVSGLTSPPAQYNDTSLKAKEPERAIFEVDGDADEPSRSYIIPQLQPSMSETDLALTPSLSHDLRRAPSAEKDAILYTTARTRSALKKEGSDLSSITSPNCGRNAKHRDSAPDEEDDITYVANVQDTILKLFGMNAAACSTPAQDSEAKSQKSRSKAASAQSKSKRRTQGKSRTGNPLPKFTMKRNDTTLLIQGFREIEPLPGKVYFPTSAERNENLSNGQTPTGRPFRIISLCIPCYNEDAAALKRSIKTLKKQKLPDHISLEVLIAMDGTEQISTSMRKYITELFGITTEEDHPNNPFDRMPKANTVIVEASNESDLDTSQLNLSLVIKRKNRRKVNSQMWWLRSHAKEVLCEFTFGTDCGIVFEKENLAMMLKRLDSQPNLSAVTGYLRVMNSRMQGDGVLEICRNPLAWFLRQLQSYDIELSQSTTKSYVDTIGFLPVLPGPCTLYRFQHLAGVMHEYFSLTTKELDADSSGIILGNVQLAEDRFPPVLLTFRDKEDCRDAGITRPHTGFLRDAVFYFEAEKPLSQFVKQRRRWINGAFIAVYWVLQESWIHNADHGTFTKLGAWLLLTLELLQGAIVRLVVPATIACGLSFMCTILPAIIDEDNDKIRDILNLEGIRAEQFGIGGAAATAYLLIYAIFMLAHTPRAVKEELPNGEIKWRSDGGSAYRPWLFAISFFINAAIVAMFLYVGIMVFLTVGWSAAPLYFRVLTIFSGLPYAVALIDGLVNSRPPNIKSFLMLVAMTPVFYLASIWFYVWFPSYASARISDLSWGNRVGSHVEETGHGDLRRRALVGRLVSISLVLTNALTAGLVLGLVHAVAGFLNAVFFTLLGFNILLSVINLVDMVIRALRPLTCDCCRWLVGEMPPAELARIEKYADPNPTKMESKLEIVAGTEYTTTDETESESDGSIQIGKKRLSASKARKNDDLYDL